MREIKIRKAAGHVCSVTGCTNRDTVAITRGAGSTGMLYLCGECLSAACAPHNGTREAADGAEGDRP